MHWALYLLLAWLIACLPGVLIALCLFIHDKVREPGKPPSAGA